MSQPTMRPGPVHAPLIEDRHDGGNLLIQRAVHRHPARLVVGQVGASSGVARKMGVYLGVE